MKFDIFIEKLQDPSTFHSYGSSGRKALWKASFDDAFVKYFGSSAMAKLKQMFSNDPDIVNYIVDNRFLMFINLRDDLKVIGALNINVFWSEKNNLFNSVFDNNAKYLRLDFDGHVLGDPFSHAQPHFDFDKGNFPKINLPRIQMASLDSLIATILSIVAPDDYYEWVKSNVAQTIGYEYTVVQGYLNHIDANHNIKGRLNELLDNLPAFESFYKDLRSRAVSAINTGFRLNQKILDRYAF